MLGKACLIGAMVLGALPASGATLFGAGARMEISYYEQSVKRNQNNGIIYFAVDGYVRNNQTQEVVPFKALFDCGMYSKIAISMDGMKRVFEIGDTVKYSQTNVGNWYALQSRHCPNNHHIKRSDEMKYD